MMELYNLGRLTKISVAVVQVISFLVFATWITLIVLQSTNVSCMPEYLSSEDLRALDTNSNGSNVFTANKTIPCIIPNPIRHLENVAVCTYGVLVSIFGMLDQVYLYYTVDHRRIRKLQAYILYSAVGSVIQGSVAVYTGLVLALWTAALLLVHVVPRTIQMILLVKFLNSLISSSPRVSIVSTTAL